MSAIFGIYAGEGDRPDQAEVLALKGYLASRGADAVGTWSDREIALGNCLLRTTPDSLYEQMPASDAQDTCVITADARLDNRDDLIAMLGLRDRPASEVPDSALILHAYRKWGESCPVHLLGDFAFAIWDRVERKLFCARDQMGVKPFYYARVGARLAFCSCVDGLLQLKWVPRRLNELHVGNYLTMFLHDPAATFYRDIVRLAPAHSLCVREREVRLQKYWELNPECETRFNSTEEYVEAFRALFEETVRTRLRTTYKVGCMLSGGLDSNSISGVAGRLLAEQKRGPLATFSGVFDDVPRTNERPFIEAAVMGGSFEPSYFAADRCNPFFAPPEFARTQSDVQVAPNMFLTLGLYGMARTRQVRVLLDGFDGDTTVSHGLGYLSELARTNRWLTLTRLIPAVAPGYEQSVAEVWWTYFWLEGLLPKVPARAVRVCQGAARRLGNWGGLGRREKVCDCILDPAFVERVGLREYRKSLDDTARRPTQTEKQAHYAKLMWPVIPAALEMINHAATPFGIEVRFPFCDRRLIEFCLGLPPDLKIRDGYTRWILRKAMEERMPRKIQWRPGKSNLAIAFRHCLFKYGRPVLDQALEAAKLRLPSYLCAKHFEFTKRRLDDTPSDKEIIYLWRVANLALWLEKTGSKHNTVLNLSQREGR